MERDGGATPTHLMVRGGEAKWEGLAPERGPQEYLEVCSRNPEQTGGKSGR